MENTYSKQTAKFIANLVQNMPELNGRSMQYWIESSTVLATVLQRAFCPDFPVWKTVKIGVHKTAKALIKAAEEAGCIVDPDMESVLNRQGISQEEKEVDLVLIEKPWTLGLHRAWDSSVCAHVQALGLEFFTAEIAMALRTDYTDQPFDPSHESNVWAYETPGGPSDLHLNYKILHCHADGKKEITYGGGCGVRCEQIKMVFIKPRK